MPDPAFTPPAATFAVWLKRCIYEHDWSDETTCTKLGVASSTLRTFKAGKAPPAGVVERLAVADGWPPDDPRLPALIRWARRTAGDAPGELYGAALAPASPPAAPPPTDPRPDLETLITGLPDLVAAAIPSADDQAAALTPLLGELHHTLAGTATADQLTALTRQLQRFEATQATRLAARLADAQAAQTAAFRVGLEGLAAHLAARQRAATVAGLDDWHALQAARAGLAATVLRYRRARQGIACMAAAVFGLGLLAAWPLSSVAATCWGLPFVLLFAWGGWALHGWLWRDCRWAREWVVSGLALGLLGALYLGIWLSPALVRIWTTGTLARP